MTYFPLLNNQFMASEIQKVDLSPGSIQIKSNDAEGTYEQLTSHLEEIMQLKGAKVLTGGYLEKRELYQNSPHFKQTSVNRNNHIGWDIWAAAGTRLYAPCPLKVHSFAYNAEILDYGATIIFECQVKAKMTYLLMGHLSLDSIQHLKTGHAFKKGQEVARLGHKYENGGCPPHLHLQFIQDLNGYEGDYPGVCSDEELIFHKNNCPDPSSLPLVDR